MSPKLKVKSVRLNYTFIAYGINSTQLAATMSGLTLEWTGEVLVVKRDSFKGEEKWVFPTGICEITWQETE